MSCNIFKIIYSKECKKEIQKVIRKHYNENEQEIVWKKGQEKYVEFLKSFRKDLGGYKNFHNHFAKENNLLEIMPAFCNPDYDAMELIHTKLIRKTTCSNGNICDYAICGDKDFYIKKHEEYIEDGYRKNK